MLVNHVKMSFRNIFKNRLYSMINIFGLAVGLSVCILIALFVEHEAKFDSSIPDSERIYRFNWESKETGARFATFFNGLSPLIADSYPADVEAVTRITISERLLSIDDKKSYEDISFVDPNFFQFFPYQFEHGSVTSALSDMNSAVLTKAAAQYLFGEENVVGRTFSLDGKYDFQVTAVIENNKSNSHLVSNIFVNMEILPQTWNRMNMMDTGNFSDQLFQYVKLAPGISAMTFENKIMDFITNNVSDTFTNGIATPLQPLSDIHFNTEIQNEMTVRDPMTGISKPHRQRTDITIFAIVAILTLIIATFNFINLQIAQSTRRIKEVGIRKVLGASRINIAAQFILESTIMCFISLLAAVVIVEMFALYFGSMLGVPLSASNIYTPNYIAGLLLTVLLVGILSGLYPALFVSGVLPVKAIRENIFDGIGSARLRAGLVIIQFSIAIGLISATGIVNEQIDFALNKSLGYEPNNVITVRLNNQEARDAYSTMHDRLVSNPNIENVSSGTIIPTWDLSDGMGFQKADAGPDFSLNTRRISVADGYFATLGMNILSGRALSDDFPADKTPNISDERPHVEGGLILNATAIKQAGWTNPEEAIGQQLYVEWRNFRFDYTIVGVVEDAHFGSVRSEPAPLSFVLEDFANVMIIKAREGALNNASAFINTVWQEQVPSYPIRQTLLSEDYASFYAVEGRVFTMFIGFAGIAALIACTGLYGLACFIADRRVKEIGIRKVLGASVFNIIILLSWELSKLVLIANVIAWPTAWILMNDWLTNFSYRIDIGIIPFLIAGLIALTLSFLTTSSRAYSAARANPHSRS